MLIYAFYSSFSSALSYKYFYQFYDLSPATTNAYNYFTTLNFLLRPIYGFLTDKLPIFGYRRKIYLFIYLILLAIIWMILTIQNSSIPLGLFLFLIISSTLVAGGIIAVSEGIMVE